MSSDRNVSYSSLVCSTGRLSDMFLLRIQMPDRSGALGQVATAIGSVGADIHLIEVVEKATSRTVIDDFLLQLSPGTLPEDLVSACLQLDGVQVLWLSRYPDGYGIESDVAIASEIGEHQERALEVLLERVPQVFHAQWAAVIGIKEEKVLMGTENAPQLGAEQIAALEPFTIEHFSEMSEAWLPGWGGVALAVIPAGPERLLVAARHGGPDFLESELYRLHHLVRLAKGTRGDRPATHHAAMPAEN